MKHWAIVGLGFIAPRHIAAIKAIGDKVVLTCDSNPNKDADFVSFDQMIESEDFKKVDNVAICVPNWLHVPMAKKCLAKGKRVLCEKPLGLSSKEIDELPNDGSVFCVLQLRHHPDFKKMKKVAKKAKIIQLDINVHRDDSYWKGWKGDEKKSGGILTNIGIHYLDLVIQLLGNKYKIISTNVGYRSISGQLKFGRTDVVFKVSINNDAECRRDFIIGETEFNLSNQENLSYEGLHTEVFKAFKVGKGVLPKDAKKAIGLIEKIKE